jgi:hypothetical protein
MSLLRVTAAIIGVFLIAGQASAEDWKQTLDKRLPEFGHRNWIVIADSAYPKQSAVGIETIYTHAGQLEVLQHVLNRVSTAKHIHPIVMLDAELKSVPEQGAPGVERYRSDLKTVLGKRPINVMPHEDIIQSLDDGAKLFNVLVLKTDMTIPYTSVFIQLDCGYWTPEKETALRELIKKSKDK